MTQQTEILKIVENKTKPKDNNDNETEDIDMNMQPTINPKLVKTLSTKLVSHGAHAEDEITDEQAFQQDMMEIELEETETIRRGTSKNSSINVK